MKSISRLRMHAFAGIVGLTAILTSLATNAEISGNIGAVSKYVFRGGTNVAENNGSAVQGGIDYSHAGGFYLGYWGSNLDYGNATSTTGFENDVYAGYSSEAGGVTYDVGVLKYVYLGVDDADALEIYGKVGYGPVAFGLTYSSDDVVWENSGDIYLTLSYETELPEGFSLGATAGYFSYDDSDKKLAGTTGPKSVTTSTSGLKHVDISLSHPLGDSGADMSVTYIVGGKDRSKVDQDDTIVLGLSYGF